MSGSAAAKVPDAGSGQENRVIKQALPSSVTELSALLAAAAKDGLIVVGGAAGRVPPQGDPRPLIYCQLDKLNQVLDHAVADQVIEVQTGIKVAELNRLLKKNGQFLPLRVPEEWTLLDAIGRGEAGTLEHGYGAVRELVLGVGAVLADGTIIATGGRVVKNVTGYDTTKLIVGAHGSLTLPFSAHLRLYALPESALTLCWSFDSLFQASQAGLKLLHSGLPFACLEVVHNPRQQSGGGRFMLLVQIFSLAAVSSEIVGSATELLGAAQQQLQGKEQDELWNDLCNYFLNAPVDQLLQVVAPPAILPDIAESLPRGSRWQMRPGRARLNAVCPAVSDAIRALADFSSRRRQTLTVAAADNMYNYAVHQLPADDAVQTALKRRIKQELDANNTFNPFVLT
jgi:FAD/FMN-containing dehydrogenase